MIATLASVVLLDVAVLCAEPQGTACAALQPRVESDLQASGLTVRPYAELAKDWPMPVPQKDSADAKAIMDEAVKAFYEGRLDVAKQKLTDSANAFASARNPVVADLVKLHLWRATVSLAMGEPPASASTEIDRVLVLDPAHVVDTTVFSTALRDFVEKQKSQTALPEATLAIEAKPAGTRIRIDDREVTTASPKVPAGKHYLTATAPGHRPLTRVIDTNDGKPIEIALAPALEPGLQRAVAANDRAALGSFLQSAALEAAVVVLPQRAGDPRVVVVTEKSASEPAVRPVTAIATHVSEVMKRGTARAVPTRTPQPGVGGGETKPFAFSVDGGLAFTSWTRAFDTDAEGYEDPVQMAGVGPRVVVAMQHASGVFVRADAMYLAYALNTLDATYAPPPSPGGEPESKAVKGGNSLHADASAGYRFVFDDRDGDADGFVAASLGYALESYGANELTRDGTDDVLPMLHSHDRSGLRVGVEAGSPVGPIHLRAGGGAWLASSYSETAGANGTSYDAAGTIPMWLLGMSWTAPTGRLVVGAEYRGQLRSVTYTGPSDSVVAVDGAKLAETLHVFSATVRVGF